MTITAVFEWLRRYWSLLSLAAAGILYALWRQKVVEVDELKLDNRTQALDGQITVLKEQATYVQKQSEASSTDYDSLKRADDGLRQQLGLTKPGTDGSNH